MGKHYTIDISSMNSTLLEQKLEEYPHYNYPSTSRIHPLKAFPKGFFVKREDELGFGISGNKFRKYRTLLPYLVQNGYREIIVLGGAFSNHILSITQLLIENGLTPTLFLKAPKPSEDIGNFLFLKMLIPISSIHWVSKNNWDKVTQLAQDYAKTKAYSFVIPEGATVFPSFVGSLTLPLDIIRNELESNIMFDHIFMDVGTGYSASGLLLGLSILERKISCHLLHLAETEKAFVNQLTHLHADCEKWLGKKIVFPSFTSYLPTIAPSFGSTNKTVFDFIITTAREEGFFLDPIYSAKLFYEIRKIQTLKGNVLVIHSGGALTLAGFQKQLSNYANDRPNFL